MLGQIKSFYITVILFIGVFIFAGILQSKAVALILFILLHITRNYSSIIIDNYVNHHVRSENRATVLSIQSFVNNAIVSLFVVFIGYTLDLYAMDVVFVALGIFVAVFSVPLLISRYGLRKRRL